MEVSPDHEDWKDWFHRHGARLFLCARQWTRSASDAEDVVQEAFLRFWRNQRTLGGDPMGLVLTSIRRAAYDLARRDYRRERRQEAAGDPADNGWFEPLAEDDDLRQAVEVALVRLPPEQREVLVMKIWGERTFEQIAAQLAISPHTAASRYRYALGALRKSLAAVTAP